MPDPHYRELMPDPRCRELMADPRYREMVLARPMLEAFLIMSAQVLTHSDLCKVHARPKSEEFWFVSDTSAIFCEWSRRTRS